MRIKAYLIVNRNQTRDFLDVAALSDRMGSSTAAAVLTDIDDYYHDQHGGGLGVSTQLARQLSEPRPTDSRTTRELSRYRRLDAKWHDWNAVVKACRELSSAMLLMAGEPDGKENDDGT